MRLYDQDLFQHFLNGQHKGAPIKTRAPIHSLLLLFTLFFFYGCGSTPTTERPTAHTIQNSIPQEQLSSFVESAEIQQEPERSQSLLKAARSMSKYDKFDWARNTLNRINLGAISDQLNGEYFILHGLINVLSGDPYLAQRYLFSDELSQLLPILEQDLSIEALELRATLLYDLAEYKDSINERLKLAQFISSETEYLELNQDLIWQTLMELSLPDLQKETQRPSNDLTQGWYSLATLAKNNQSNIQTQLENIDKWVKLWPEHPASLTLPADLQLLKQLAGQQAQYIAVLLPLSGRLEKASSAIQDGILAAFYESTYSSGLKPNMRFYDTNLGDINTIYDKAVNNGAELVIGPLSKANIATLSRRAFLPVNTLALNSLDYGIEEEDDTQKISTNLDIPSIEHDTIDTETLLSADSNDRTSTAFTEHTNISESTGFSESTNVSDGTTIQENVHEKSRLYQFGLSVEEEVEQIAERAWRDGHRRAMLIVPDRLSGQRSAEKFKSSWLEMGGEIVGDFKYAQQREYHQLIGRAMQTSQSKQRYQEVRQRIGTSAVFEARRRKDIDFIFLVSRPQEARQIKPGLAYHYAGAIPVYATSDIYNGKTDATANKDIKNVRFTTIPWFFDSDTNEKKSINAYTKNSAPYQKLYAFGIDAYRLYPRLEQLRNIKQAHFYGATGRLGVNENNVIERKQIWAEFRRGRAILLGEGHTE